jgi:hypothetical protein
MASTDKFIWKERHKDICPILKKWRQVQKGHLDAKALTADMLAYLAA